MAQRWAEALKNVLPSYTTSPSVQQETPEYTTVHKAGQAITITAEACDREEGVKRVEFYVNCQKIGEYFTSPCEINWTPSETGTYYLHAEATDAAGAMKESDLVSVSVIEAQAAKITREYWTGVLGTTVADIPLNITPTSITELLSYFKRLISLHFL